MSKKEAFRRTSLTSRQWEVIRYRAKGLTQAELAGRLKTSRENVNQVERRARTKIEAAKATLAALQELDTTKVVLIPKGTSVFEAVSLIILRADVLGVRLLASGDEVLAAIRSRWRNRIRGHRLTCAVKAEIEADGSLLIKSPGLPQRDFVLKTRDGGSDSGPVRV